jgi:phage terminase small subunit
MPRTSADAVAAAAIGIATSKLAPPDHLTAEQAAIWTRVVNQLPAEQVAGDNEDLLAAYCRHTSYARHLAVEIEALRDKSLGVVKHRTALAALLRMHSVETKALSSLSVKLGLALQCRYQQGESAANKRRIEPNTPAPWEGWQSADALSALEALADEKRAGRA